MSNQIVIGVNAKYIHTNLAIRDIAAYAIAHGTEVTIFECSINDNIHTILKKIIRQLDGDKPVRLAFSCYIWNAEMIGRLVASLKQINPSYTIILGGPEVSFDGPQTLAHLPADFVIQGEGEVTYTELLQALDRGETDFSSIKGLVWRRGTDIITNPERPLLADLNEIPFPYKDLSAFQNKIIYYETTRGCPFGCKYCLSSVTEGVRYYALERVKQELKFFVDGGVKQVKLVDRTFNCNKARAVELMQYIVSLGGHTNFHFEISADIVDDAFIHALAASPKGTFQLEIGIQSTYEPTLDEINRKAYFHTIAPIIRRLIATGKAHIHVDLIAGLPYETLDRFQQSFDDVIALHPDMLQLGFLKLLKGSRLRIDEANYDYRYDPFAPYEVISNHWMTYDDILYLKEMEELLERFYNSGRFRQTFSYIETRWKGHMFQFFAQFLRWWNDQKLFDGERNLRELYLAMFDFLCETNPSDRIEIAERLRFDFMKHNFHLPLPAYLESQSAWLPRLRESLKDPDFLARFLPECALMKPKERNQTIRYEVFQGNIAVIFFRTGDVKRLETHWLDTDRQTSPSSKRG